MAVHWSGNAAGAEQVAQDIRVSGGFAQLMRGDLTVVGEAKRVVEDSAQLLGGLDVLIDNAGSLVSRTRHLARDFAARNIRVNTVSPGVVDTPFHHATPPERMQAMRKSVCMGRIGTPADCVGAFLFLASNELSGYITGQNIHVNGGQVMP